MPKTCDEILTELDDAALAAQAAYDAMWKERERQQQAYKDLQDQLDAVRAEIAELEDDAYVPDSCQSAWAAWAEKDHALGEANLAANEALVAWQTAWEAYEAALATWEETGDHLESARDRLEDVEAEIAALEDAARPDESDPALEALRDEREALNDEIGKLEALRTEEEAAVNEAFAAAEALYATYLEADAEHAAALAEEEAAWAALEACKDAHGDALSARETDLQEQADEYVMGIDFDAIAPFNEAYDAALTRFNEVYGEAVDHGCITAAEYPSFREDYGI